MLESIVLHKYCLLDARNLHANFEEVIMFYLIPMVQKIPIQMKCLSFVTSVEMFEFKFLCAKTFLTQLYRTLYIIQFHFGDIH